MTSQRRVFISYSHDSDAHCEWVKSLAEYIMGKGIDVVFDQWAVDYGDDLPTFMEKSVRGVDYVISICTDAYISKANSGIGGVGYEKTIATAEISRDSINRKHFIPIVRNVNGSEKLPSFYGDAFFLDLSDDCDSEDNRYDLVRFLSGAPIEKPKLGSSLPERVHEHAASKTLSSEVERWCSNDGVVEFSDRFSLAFPGLRDVEWFDDLEVIAERLDILLRKPLNFNQRKLAWWWRGHQNLHIRKFRRLNGSHFLMDVHELNIRRVAAVNQASYYNKFVYVETNADLSTGLYSSNSEDLESRLKRIGYNKEEYGLVDGSLAVTREEYDDGAALIAGKPVDISESVSLRVRYVTPYNFIIAPHMSPINNHSFDEDLNKYMNQLTQNNDVFSDMCQAISRLPKRN